MQAFEIYEQMQEEGANPDQTTYTSVLSACTNQLTLLTFGAQIHSDIIDHGFEPDVVVGTSLLNMYGKCGSLEDAHKTFDQMSEKNVVSWNVMISIYSQHGHAREAIHCVHKMQEDRIVPNKVTFIALISACSHGGMLVEGCTNLDPLLIVHDARVSLELYHCVFDLLGRAGLVEEAKDLLCMMPLQPSLISWVTVLGACRNQADVVHGSCAAKHVFELDPNNTATTLMLETIYDNFASDASSSLVHC
jgi:pentatricopeptide repeat protein